MSPSSALDNKNSNAFIKSSREPESQVKKKKGVLSPPPLLPRPFSPEARKTVCLRVCA